MPDISKFKSVSVSTDTHDKLMHVQKNNKNYYLLYMRDNEINLPNFTFKRHVW